MTWISCWCREELMWLYKEGASFLFPDKWEKFIEPIPKVERGDMLSAYHRRYM
jgi:proline iminopeptidase